MDEEYIVIRIPDKIASTKGDRCMKLCLGFNLKTDRFIC